MVVTILDLGCAPGRPAARAEEHVETIVAAHDHGPDRRTRRRGLSACPVLSACTGILQASLHAYLCLPVSHLQREPPWLHASSLPVLLNSDPQQVIKVEEDKAAQRMDDAVKWTDKELRKLIEQIKRLGAQGDDGVWSVKFGLMFAKTGNIFEALSGTLLTAKKHQVRRNRGAGSTSYAAAERAGTPFYVSGIP